MHCWDVVAPGDGGDAPRCGAPVHGHAAVAFWMALCGLLASACAKRGSGVLGKWRGYSLTASQWACLGRCACQKGWWRGPLGGLPVSEPGVCCNTGHRVGVDVVDAARLTEFLRDWARRM